MFLRESYCDLMIISEMIGVILFISFPFLKIYA